MAIKGIVFDLDGVYFESGKEEFMQALKHRFGLSYEEVKEVFIKSPEMERYKEGRMSGIDFWRFARERWCIDATISQLLALLASSYTVNRKAQRLLRHLHKKGYKIIACSNNFKERISVLDKRFNFLRDFDVVVFSYCEGIRKPELLRCVIKKTHLSPEEVLFLDDHEALVISARRAGFRAIYCGDPAKIELYLAQGGIHA